MVFILIAGELEGIERENRPSDYPYLRKTRN